MPCQRRAFLKGFKREAVKLVGRPRASKVATVRDLGLGANLLRSDIGRPTWTQRSQVIKRGLSKNMNASARAGKGQDECDILEKRSAVFQPTAREVGLHRQMSNHLTMWTLSWLTDVSLVAALRLARPVCICWRNGAIWTSCQIRWTAPGTVTSKRNISATRRSPQFCENRPVGSSSCGDALGDS